MVLQKVKNTHHESKLLVLKFDEMAETTPLKDFEANLCVSQNQTKTSTSRINVVQNECSKTFSASLINRADHQLHCE
jgi:hypothetical protein